MSEEALPQAKMELCSERSTFSEMMFHLREIGRECVIPAIVEEYDRGTHMATVKPIVQYSKDTVSGSVDYDRPTYKNIRVMQMRHGGYMIDWPIKVGDTGILIAVDRSWNKVAEANGNDDESQNKGAGPADDYSLALFENGIFIPDSWVSDKGSDYENDNTLVIRGLKKDCSIDLIIDDPNNTKAYLKKFSVRHDGLYLDDKPFKPEGGMNLISGDYSNVVFTDVTEGDYAGKTKIDIFYK